MAYCKVKQGKIHLDMSEISYSSYEIKMILTMTHES